MELPPVVAAAAATAKTTSTSASEHQQDTDDIAAADNADNADADASNTKMRKGKRVKFPLKKSQKPFWVSKDERAEAEMRERRLRGEMLSRLVKRANPAHDPASELAAAFDARREQSVARAEAVTASLQEQPHDPDTLAEFRINVKDVAATRPYLVVPPITAPRKHRIPVEHSDEEGEEAPFDFMGSFWAPRQAESDAKDYYDTEDVFRRRLGVDWKRCMSKVRFKDFIMKEDMHGREEKERREELEAEGKEWNAEAIGGKKESLWQRTKATVNDHLADESDLLFQEKANPSLLDHLGPKELAMMKKMLEKQEREKIEREAGKEENILNALRTELRSAYPVLCSIHAYYSVLSGTTGDTFFSVKMVGWREFLEDAAIPEAESDACKQEDCDRIFMAANIMDREHRVAMGDTIKFNTPDSLSRWEFIEAIIRLACAKYIPSVKTTTTVTAKHRKPGAAVAAANAKLDVTFTTTRTKHQMKQVASSVPEALHMLMKHVAPLTPPPSLHQLSAMMSKPRARWKDATGVKAEGSRQSMFRSADKATRGALVARAGAGAGANQRFRAAILAVVATADMSKITSYHTHIARSQPEAVMDHNKFRANRIYNNAVSDTLKKWKPLLQGMYNYFKSKVRGKRMHMDEFVNFCEESGLISKKTGLSRREARLVFVFSQMEVVDDVAKHYNAVTASFFDFCEAFCRLVDALCPPSQAEILEYFTHGYRRFGIDDIDENYALANPHIAYYLHVPESEVIDNQTPWHGSIIETPEEAIVDEAEEAGLPNPLGRDGHVSMAGSAGAEPQWEWRRRPLAEMIPDAMKIVMEHLCLRYMQQSSVDIPGDAHNIAKSLVQQLNKEAKGLTVGIYDY